MKKVKRVRTVTHPMAVQPEPTAASFPIVGIGASAGGLAAFEAFFSAMPPGADPGMAFVLVQHLAPDHKSILSELVRRYTRMQVFEVTDGMAVRPNCAYIIPPNRDMAFLNGTLQLLEPVLARGQRLPIDFFFRSLAQDQRERAIGVVLSGTGSDGTLGVRAIKGEGGMAMAQNPASTEFDGMPRSAIATGLVDFVLPPAEMPARLIAYTAHAFGREPRPITVPAPAGDDALKKIFVLLRTQTGHDFSQYKPSTIARRIERRMAVHQIERLNSYVQFLRTTPSEVEALFRDLLIGVTSFFRDREVFAALEQEVIPRLLEGRPAGAPVRVWVPGCSTGEEAYSIAILIEERMAALKRKYKLQVFATDVDGKAIEQARAGIYPATIAADLTPERLAGFFKQEADGGTYRIQKSLRDQIVFSEQDVIRDPPFSKLDLISCRNLLIYMDVTLQKKLMPLFHYALNPGGTLLLSTSETVGEFMDLFVTLDRKAKLYRRKDELYGAQYRALGRFAPPLTMPDSGAVPVDPESGRIPLRERVERSLLQQYAPAGVLVTAQGDILYLHGRTGLFLEPAAGEAHLNILKMAREGLRHDLTLALHQAATSQQPVQHPNLRIKTNGDFSTFHLSVQPMAAKPEDPAGPALFLVVLEKAPAVEPAPTAAPAATRGAAARIAALQQELRVKEDFLQSTNEELETANEELKSSNEEMQSINEELETSKEELQSVNEELATVNAELQTKVADLSQANNDMNNLLAGTGIGTIFVDRQLRILRFTPPAAQVINLILTDVGRPLVHIVSNLVGYHRLEADVQAVLDTLTPREVEVQTQAGAWYLLRLRPYRTQDNVIEGAVLTFTDITELKKTQVALREAATMRRLAAVVRDARDAILMLDLDGRILDWNPAATRLYGWTEAEALALNIRDLIPEDQRSDALAVVRRLALAEVVEPYRARRIAKDGHSVEVWLAATALINDAGQAYAIATTERAQDIHEST